VLVALFDHCVVLRLLTRESKMQDSETKMSIKWTNKAKNGPFLGCYQGFLNRPFDEL
jgi:hypothetical protein